jgi:cobalamin biosynthesis protein CobT
MKTHDLQYELTQTAAVFGRDGKVTMVFEGERAYTDGEQIVLPSLPQGVEVDHDAVMTMRGYADHEAGHIRHTDFKTFMKFASTCSPQAKNIHNCLEDMWLEDRVMKEYPGSEKNLRKLTETLAVKEQENILAHPETYKTVSADAVCNAILRTGRYDYGGDLTKQMFHEMPAKMQEWGKEWAKLAKNAKSTKELCNLALEIEKLLDSTSSSADMSKPEPQSGGKGLEGNPSDFKFDPDGDVTEGSLPSKNKNKGNPIDGKGKAITTKDLTQLAEEFMKSQVDQYFDANKGEIGKKYRVLSTRYDEVLERDRPSNGTNSRHKAMRETSVSKYEQKKAKLSGVVNTMKAKLRRALVAKEQRDWDFGREHGRLDSKRLVSGVLGSSTIYKARKDRFELDTAIHFLIDLSGSMSGDKIETACESVIALCECLEGTSISYQVTGFSNYLVQRDDHWNKLLNNVYENNAKYHRYEPLMLHKFKRFNEPLQVAKGAIASISDCAGGHNSDRDAVLWAYQELKKRPEKRKILFVLSDGQPANDQINVSGDLVEFLKDAVQEVVKSGVECIGVGIDDITVNSIYPKSVSITDVNDLSGTIFVQLSNLLTGGKVNF